MSRMVQTVEQALQQAQLYTDETLYRIIHLPPNAITVAAGILAQVGEPFASVIVDKDEVTLIIPADAMAEFASRLRHHHISGSPYRLITFDLELEPTLTGFLAKVSAVLAEANVPIMPLAAFSRDHILVPAERFEAAWSALRKLQVTG
jgi:hypothetical protein